MSILLVQCEALTTPPAEQFEEVQAGVEDLVVLKHHLVEGVNGKVPVGVCVLESGHGGVESVGLVAKWRVVHCDDFVCVLRVERGEHSIRTRSN